MNAVKSEHELKLIASHGIKIHTLTDIVSSLAKERFVIGSASGADIIDLLHMFTHSGCSVKHNPSFKRDAAKARSPSLLRWAGEPLQ